MGSSQDYQTHFLNISENSTHIQPALIDKFLKNISKLELQLDESWSWFAVAQKY